MRISDWSSDVCSSDLGQIRLPEDDGYSHLKLKLEQGGFFGPVARLCASRHLLAGGVKPDNCIRLCEWQYDQSLLPISLHGPNAFTSNHPHCGVYPRSARGLPRFNPCTDSPGVQNREGSFSSP